MRWYEGSITEAITISKSKGAVFVVYIEGKDDKSSHITNLINTELISGKLESNAFVAVKLEADSLPHQQFSQIYKETPVPSIYFLGKQGTPLEIVTEADNSHLLAEKIDSILQRANVKTDSTTNDALAKQSASFIQTEQSSNNVVCDDASGVCTIIKSSPSSDTSQAGTSNDLSSPSTTTGSDLTTDEKIERAKELVEKKRLEKLNEDKEQERLKELERRKMGQSVQQLKKWQEDQELKKVLEERERDKRENQAARNRVLAQIAQDKAERASKFASQSNQVQSPQPQSQSQRPANSNNSTTARLQFRLPDGSSSTMDFASRDLLETVHQYIRENLNLPFSSYTLATAFPRREFNDKDKSETLADLQLVPTAVLLVLPINHHQVSSNPGGGLVSMFWFVLTPIWTVYNYVKGYLFGGSSGNTSGTTGGTKRAAEPSTSTSTATRVEPKRRAGGETKTTVVQRQSNVHRLSDKKDSDDENNTWNGNSTQQM